MRRSVVPDRVAALSIAILVALVALTISGVIAAMASGTETRSLTSSADTQIVENAPAKNYGAATSLGVNENDQSSIGKDKFALIKWDLSGIGPRMQINSASVTLNVTNSSTETYQAHVLKQPWVESAATWNVYSSGEPWEVAGAKGSLDKEATVAGSITPSVKGKNTLTLPVAVVQGWVDNPDTNQGIIIAYPSSTRGFNFNSREDTDPTQRPQLTLDLIPDTTPPQTTIDSGPPGTISSGDVSFTFSSSEAGSSYECSLDSAAYTACTSPQEYTNLSEGSHTFSVKATDSAGNTDASPASTTWTVDTTAPETTITDGPSGTVNTRSAHFSFSATEDGSTFECSLDGSDFEPCSLPKEYTEEDLSEGSHTLEVKAKDAAGNTDPTPASRIWTVDTTSPEATIATGPAEGAALSSGNVSFTFSSNEAGSALECSLDSAAYTACTSPQEYTNLSEGSHTFSVKATDSAGNTDASPASTTWTVDTTAPETTIDSGPSGTISVDEATFKYSSEEGDNFECRLDGSAYSTCTSNKTKRYTKLSNGSHTFDVRATDRAGNVDATPASRTFGVEVPPPPQGTTAPETTIDSGPSGTINVANATFAFSSDETNSTFECSLDGASFEPCSSPQSYTDLSEGSHTLEVKATDQGSNTDLTPASRIWTVDTTSPEATIDMGPADGATLSSGNVSFTFSSNEAGSALECSLDSAAYTACTSPQEYTNLSEGSHTFSVRATDAAGNTDASPPSTTWTVDTTTPETKIDSNPDVLTNSASASFGFSSTEPGSGFQCKLDSGAYESCTSPKSLTGLSDGSHTFSVKATDAASNTDQSPATYTWTVDTTPPDTSITDGPAEAATDTDGNVTFTFTGTDNKAIARYEVKNVKDGVEEPFLSNGLSTTKTFTNLANGSYSFKVRALDGAGNISALAVRNYSVSIPASDTTPPDTSIISGPAEGSTDTDGNVSFSFSSTEANSTFKCKLDSGTYGSCTSPKDYTNLADGAHTFSVRATDSAGNTDPSPASRNFNVSVPVSRVSVTDFGATAGDNGNDTVAFENAMAAAGPGEVVWVPDGVGAYRVYRVNIPSNTDMDVAAGAVIKFYGTNNGRTFGVQGPTASTFAQNIHIQGVGGSFTLDLSDAGAVSAGGFAIENVDGFSLKHMNCINNNSNLDTTYPSSRPSCIVPSPANTTQRADGTYNDPRNLVFEDIHGYGGPYGFGLFQFTAGSNVQLTNISGEGGVAVRLENYANWTPMKNITMNGVTCKDGHTAINFNPHGATHQGNIHINNVTANSCESAVSIAGSGTYGPDVSVDGVTAVLGYAAQVRDNDPTNAIGSWVIGPSQYCIDDRTNAYTVALSSLHCGGLPNRDKVF